MKDPMGGNTSIQEAYLKQRNELAARAETPASEEERVDIRKEKMKADGAAAREAYENFMEGWEREREWVDEGVPCGDECPICGVSKQLRAEILNYGYRVVCGACRFEFPCGVTLKRAWKNVQGDSALEALAEEAVKDMMINRPDHYAEGDIECIDVIEHQEMGFHIGNVQKYIWRWEKKGGVDDLKKARWYLNRKIEMLEQYE